VQFVVDGVASGLPVTLAGGTASISIADLSAGQHTVAAFYVTDTSDFENSNNSANPLSHEVAKADQTIDWNNPAAIVAGTALSSVQLNATVSVVGPAPAGALTYTPPGGTVLNTGDDQVLTVIAAETDNYKSATATVLIDVLPQSAYNFGGFLAPLGTTKTHKAGSAISIKFLLSDPGGNPVTSLGAVSSLQVQYTDKNGNTSLLTPSSTNGLGLRNDDGQYIFNWKTKGLAAGQYTILLTLADGSIKTFALELT
jgi:hypothetical protein